MDTLYSHRLKTVLQLMVRDLGMALSIDDSNAAVALAENEPMIRETVKAAGLNVEFVKNETGTIAVFYR